MTPEVVGLYAGLAGSAVGILGGIFGTWASVRAAKSIEERRYLMKCAAGFWVGISLFLGVLLAVPTAYRGLVWIPYAPLLVLGILACNRGQQRFRDADRRVGS